MRYRPKIINLANGSRDIEAWAVRKCQDLERRRLMLDVPFLKHTDTINGVLVVLESCELRGNKILLIGGILDGHIMLVNDSGVFTTYNYLKDKIDKAAALSEFSLNDSVLSPIYNRRCQVGERAGVGGTKNWSAFALDDGSSLQYLGGVNAYEQAYFTDLNQLYVRNAELLQAVAVKPSGFTLLPNLCGAYLNLFSFAAYPMAAYWNQYQAASLFSITPTNGAVHETGTWLPSFFVVEPTDAYGLKPGWYYGRYPNSAYSFDDPLTSLNVSLVAALETLLPTGTYSCGWAEMVTAVDGEPQQDIYVYLEPLSSCGNDYAYRELVTGLYTHAAMTIGSALQGFSAAFVLQASVAGVKPDQVKLWNFDSYTTENHTSQDAVGVLLIEGTRCRGYRYKGGVTTFIDTLAFHSYAISRDGTMVAIFEGVENLITGVKVFDLYGSREEALKEEPIYSGGGYTLVQDSLAVEPLQALSACFIPYRDKDFDPSPFVFSSLGIPSPVSRDEFSALGTLRFIKSGTGGLQIDKVVCKNGIDASFGISVDECFSSEVVVDDPDEVSDTDWLVSKWDEGGNWRGVVRGIFEGDHPSMRFRGVGNGGSGWYGIITLNPTLSIMKNEDGSYSIDGVAGEIISTSCLTEEMELDPLCIPDCQGTITITAASSCGQTGKHVIEQEPAILLISGPDTFSGSFVASGGTPPHKFSSSCGEINETTGEVVSLTGCCGEVIVTVEDVCGQIASMPVRGPSGAWNTVSITDKVDDTIYTCTSQYDTSDKWKGFCDISNCYCGSKWYYLGPTLRFHTCKVPGWGPGFLIDDCSRSYCYVVTQRFECTSIPHVIDC